MISQHYCLCSVYPLHATLKQKRRTISVWIRSASETVYHFFRQKNMELKVVITILLFTSTHCLPLDKIAQNSANDYSLQDVMALQKEWAQWLNAQNNTQIKFTELTEWIPSSSSSSSNLKSSRPFVEMLNLLLKVKMLPNNRMSIACEIQCRKILKSLKITVFTFM